MRLHEGIHIPKEENKWTDAGKDNKTTKDIKTLVKQNTWQSLIPSYILLIVVLDVLRCLSTQMCRKMGTHLEMPLG